MWQLLTLSSFLRDGVSRNTHSDPLGTTVSVITDHPHDVYQPAGALQILIKIVMILAEMIRSKIAGLDLLPHAVP